MLEFGPGRMVLSSMTCPFRAPPSQFRDHWITISIGASVNFSSRALHPYLIVKPVLTWLKSCVPRVVSSGNGLFDSVKLNVSADANDGTTSRRKRMRLVDAS